VFLIIIGNWGICNNSLIILNPFRLTFTALNLLTGHHKGHITCNKTSSKRLWELNHEPTVIKLPLERLCESDHILVSVYLCLMLICCGLTLLIGHQEEHLACKKWMMRCWRGYLSRARCKWFAYDRADATATTSSLALLKSRMVSPFWCQLTQVVMEKRLLNGCLFVLLGKTVGRFAAEKEAEDVDIIFAGPLRCHYPLPSM